MQRHAALEIPSKSTIKLSPGDYHLMLFNPKMPLKIGDMPVFIFGFSDGTQIRVKANIIKRNNQKLSKENGLKNLRINYNVRVDQRFYSN